MKRQISFILMAAVLLALSLQACKKDKTTGPFGGGEGTNLKPYLINTAADLNKLREVINNGEEPYAAAGVYYRLSKNITMPEDNFTPIGTEDNWFKGNFDGNGKIITGLTIYKTTVINGLFGRVIDGKISNLGLAGVKIQGGSNSEGYSSTGGIAGSIGGGGSITGCYVTGLVSGSGHYVGGIAGYVYSGAAINNCYTACTVSGTSREVGGIVGWLYGTVNNCYATGAISGMDGCGGIIGDNAGTVNNCVALNPSIEITAGGDGTYFGRVTGYSSGTLSGNAAYKGMKVLGFTVTDGTGNGLGVGLAEVGLATAWTALGFVSPTWTVQNNKLPGLFGNTVAIPEHIK